MSIEEATHLANASLQLLGYDEAQANTISDHLIDSELRGFGIAGLARILSIGDRLKGTRPATAAKITRDAPATVQIDGQDTLGYLVGHEATKLAIEKCKVSGVSVVGVNGTWYTGKSVIGTVQHNETTILTSAAANRYGTYLTISAVVVGSHSQSSYHTMPRWPPRMIS